MKTINENNGLTIEQLEERFEMTVASSGSGSEDCACLCDCKTGEPFGTEGMRNN
jgi:hypothetical protein